MRGSQLTHEQIMRVLKKHEVVATMAARCH